MKKLLIVFLAAAMCFLLFACGAPAPEPAQTDAAQTEAPAEPAADTAAPTEEPTPEPTEEPTPAPTAEPEYWKYVLLRDELMGSFATTQDAWNRMKEIYSLEKELNSYVCGLFLVNWDTFEYDYLYRMNGMVGEFLMMAEYEEGGGSAVCRVFYDPEDPEAFEVVAPGVIRVDRNPWLKELPDYPPVYFISLESEDPAAGCWISAYLDVPETVLHAASVTEEQMDELNRAVHAKKVADSGLVLSEGELTIDGVDYKALRNHLIDRYLSAPEASGGLFDVLYALEKNPFDKTPNAAFFVNWEYPNGFRWTGWYMNEAEKAYTKLQKSLKTQPTAEQIMPVCFYPDKAEKLDDYIYRTTENDWLKKMGGEIIWISLNSDDPATGYWIGFYGPVPDVVWD